jgi:hypothetical protein
MIHCRAVQEDCSPLTYYLVLFLPDDVAFADNGYLRIKNFLRAGSLKDGRFCSDFKNRYRVVVLLGVIWNDTADAQASHSTVWAQIASGQGAGNVLGEEGMSQRCTRAVLPESSLTRILEGAPAERYIRAERRRALQNAQQLQLAAEKEAAVKSKWRRLFEEKQTGCHSDALARLILLSLKGKWGGAHAVQLIGEVERENRRVADRLVVPSSNPSKTLALCGWGKETGDGSEMIAFSTIVLVTALPLIAPEWDIRCRALTKARNALENPRQCFAKLRGQADI